MKRRTLAALLAATLCLPGCGPGAGGTGTGNELSLAAFGASAAPACSARFASQLSCSTSGTGGTLDPQTSGSPLGTATIRYVDVASAPRMVVQFDGNAMSLDARCLGFSFAGEWGATPQGEQRYYGSYLPDGTAQRMAASIEVQAVGATLQITLRDLAGQVLHGPISLVQAPPALPPFGTCGS